MAKFSKKHYEMIAKVMKDEMYMYKKCNRSDIKQSVIAFAVSALGSMLAKDNAQFDMARFEKACGI